jgi:hypothetical protein
MIILITSSVLKFIFTGCWLRYTNKVCSHIENQHVYIYNYHVFRSGVTFYTSGTNSLLLTPNPIRPSNHGPTDPWITPTHLRLSLLRTTFSQFDTNHRLKGDIKCKSSNSTPCQSLPTWHGHTTFTWAAHAHTKLIPSIRSITILPMNNCYWSVATSHKSFVQGLGHHERCYPIFNTEVHNY